MVVDIAYLRWWSNEWFQPIRFPDTYFNRAKCNRNDISVSHLVDPNNSLHYISITFALLHFKCNYICQNLSGFTPIKMVVILKQGPDFDGILPKGPYPPCLGMADRALLAGYPRFLSGGYLHAHLECILVFQGKSSIWNSSGYASTGAFNGATAWNKIYEIPSNI